MHKLACLCLSAVSSWTLPRSQSQTNFSHDVEPSSCIVLSKVHNMSTAIGGTMIHEKLLNEKQTLACGRGSDCKTEIANTSGQNQFAREGEGGRERKKLLRDPLLFLGKRVQRNQQRVWVWGQDASLWLVNIPLHHLNLLTCRQSHFLFCLCGNLIQTLCT